MSNSSYRGIKSILLYGGHSCGKSAVLDTIVNYFQKETIFYVGGGQFPFNGLNGALHKLIVLDRFIINDLNCGEISQILPSKVVSLSNKFKRNRIIDVSGMYMIIVLTTNVVPRDQVEICPNVKVAVEFSKIRPHSEGENDYEICDACVTTLYPENLEPAARMKEQQIQKLFNGCEYYCTFRPCEVNIPKKKLKVIRSNSQLAKV